MEKFNKPNQTGTTGGLNNQQGGANAPQQGNKQTWGGGKQDQGKGAGMGKTGQTGTIDKNKDQTGRGKL